MNNNGKKFNFNRNSNQQPATSAATSASTKSITTTNNNILQQNNDYDEDLLDISDNELIRASQVVESQLKFTNNVHHTTSNALTIFSQFNNNNNNNDTIMAPPSTTFITGGLANSTTIYCNSQQYNAIDPHTQIDDLKAELKQIRTEFFSKDGEVKILREKLKRVEQDMQRMRTGNADTLKKLQQQQEESQKNLKKQIELKELENQLKTQEMLEITSKYKQLETNFKKNQLIKPTNASNTTTTTTAGTNLQTSMAFDEAFSMNKKNNIITSNFQQQQQQQQATGRKRLAPSTSFLSLSDNENENPVQENKRPTLVQQQQTNKDQEKCVKNVSPATTTPVSATTPSTTIASNSALTNRPVLSPFSSNSIINPQSTKTESKLQTSKSTPTPSTSTSTAASCSSINTSSLGINKQKSLNPSMALTFNSIESKSKFQAYKRSCKLNLKPSILVSNNTISSSLNNSKEIKTKTNEKIYKLIDLFAISECVLKEFNKSTLPDTIINMNATNSCFQTLSTQLNNLLEFISYKSETKTIPNDFFSISSSSSATNNSGGSLTSDSSLILIIERVEFVSNKLNEELIKLIKYCLNASLQDGLVLNNTPSKTKKHSTSSSTSTSTSSFNKTSPASIISIVDLLCLSFEASYSLFLFRVKFLHSQYELNKKNLNNKLLSKTNSNKHKQATHFIYNTLIKLKQEFFKLIIVFLKSINFSTSSLVGSTTSTTTSTKGSGDNTINLSNSSTSYSTLKILNVIIDCFNHLIYLPCLNKKLEPDSILTVFYFSLIDNMHNIFKKKLNKFKRFLLNSQENRPELEQYEEEEEENEDDCFSSEFDDDDEPCLFKLFYEKIIKYFGEIVYSLEFYENSNTNNNESNENSNSNNNNNYTTSDDNSISIITTIVTDDNSRLIAPDLDKQKTNPKPIAMMTSSKSQNDLLLETLQTQTSLSNDDWKEKFDTNNSNVNSNSCSLNQSLNGTSLTNKCVHLLQTQLLSNFIHFVHNYQLFSFLLQKNDFENTHHKHCGCYKDLMSSFLILIDYQFNEKFICGANLNIENCFFSTSSSYSLYSPDLLPTGSKILENEKDSFVNISDQNESNSKICKLNDKTNRFMFLLIIRCFNALVNLFTFEMNNNNNSALLDSSSSEEQRVKFYKSIKDDYRLKNFCCLYSLTDMFYEYFLKKHLTKMSLTSDDYKQNASRNEPNYLYSSLESLRYRSNSIIDKYFDLD